MNSYHLTIFAMKTGSFFTLDQAEKLVQTDMTA